jgi:hypothetical protein
LVPELQSQLEYDGYLRDAARHMTLSAAALFTLAISEGVGFDSLDGGELLVQLPRNRGYTVISPCGCQRPATAVRKSGYVLPIRSSHNITHVLPARRTCTSVAKRI